MNIDREKLGKKTAPVADDFLASMFSPGAGGEGVTQVPIAQLTPWRDADHDRQPFRPYTPEKLAEMAENIAQVGILSPVYLRPFGDGYQILAGHNRVEAAKLAGLNTVPAIVRSVDDDTAKEILTSTNLHQRETLLPSEKAFAYKMKLDAIKHQGERTDPTSRQLVGRLESADRIGAQQGESGRQVQRYIRLTFLLPALLDMVDEESVPFVAGESISYLSPEQQQLLLGIMRQEKIKKLTNNQAGELKAMREELNAAAIRDILGVRDEDAAPLPKPLVLKIGLDDVPATTIKRLTRDERLHALVEDLVLQYLQRKDEYND